MILVKPLSDAMKSMSARHWPLSVSPRQNELAATLAQTTPHASRPSLSILAPIWLLRASVSFAHLANPDWSAVWFQILTASVILLAFDIEAESLSFFLLSGSGSGSGSGMVTFGLSSWEPSAKPKPLVFLTLGLPPRAPFSRFVVIFSCVILQVSCSFFCEISPLSKIRNTERRVLTLRHLAGDRPAMRALSRSSSGTLPLRRHIAPSSRR